MTEFVVIDLLNGYSQSEVDTPGFTDRTDLPTVPWHDYRSYGESDVQSIAELWAENEYGQGDYPNSYELLVWQKDQPERKWRIDVRVEMVPSFNASVNSAPEGSL